MGTAFSEQSKQADGGSAPAATDVKTSEQQPVVSKVIAPTDDVVAISPTTVTESTDSVDATHPRSQNDSKAAFARVAAATESEKNDILSAELASAEAKADINLAQFFDALESRCETDEEREELKRIMIHRKEEQQRWKLAQSGQDPNSIRFPTGEQFVTPTVPASSLEWWAGLPSAGGPRDANEQVFPLRHFEAKGDADQATQEEVATSAESLREEMIKVGAGGWVSDELADGEVVNNKDLSWVCTPPITAMTEAEIKFLNAFWERRGLGDEDKSKDFNTEVDAPEVSLENIIANDVTTPDQEAVIKLRETRGALPDEVRQRRVKLLAQHFAEREQKKLQAKCKSDSLPKVDPAVPASTFFEERLEVATEETTKSQQAKRLAAHETVIDALAEEGSKYTSFGSPNKASQETDGSEGKTATGFPFTSPEAKARVDAIIAKREKDRGEAALPQRLPPPPPSEADADTAPDTTVTPPPSNDNHVSSPTEAND